MREASAILQVERRLVELACPPALLERKMRELSEHHEDLKQEALEEGLSESDAGARADELLGEPYALAEQLAAALRQSSWWGRHPILGFCVLPLAAIEFAVILLYILFLLSAPAVFPLDLANVLAHDTSGEALLRNMWQLIYCAMILLVTALFCRLSRRTLGGTKWAVITCVVCALNGWLMQLRMQINPQTLTIDYKPNPQWFPILTALAVAALIYWLRWRTLAKCGTQSAAWTEARQKFRATMKARKKAVKRKLTKITFTPTTTIVSLMFLALLPFTHVDLWADSNTELRQQRLREQQLHEIIWPAERAAVLKKIAARQLIKETKGETTISLKSKVTLALNASSSGEKGNTLAELPTGTHIFGGVPFDVEGRVQLWGRGLADFGKIYPEHVRNIAVGRNCNRIHLLHGSEFTSNDLWGKAIARLVLHYVDGSVAEIAIKHGEHLRDWWGPIYRTDVSQTSPGTSTPGTELAWTGSNPWIKERKPEYSLRLYKSTFLNPYPERRLASIDYDSQLSNAAPFMVGMTVE